MKILIIEDEEILARVLKEKLEKAGFDVRTNGSGVSDPIKLVGEFKPDMIFLDLILPGKDGFQILKELKTNPELSTIPVIVLSNLGQDEDIKKAMSLGAEDYFVKTQHPINEIVDKAKDFLIKKGK